MSAAAELLQMACDQVALEGVQGITLSKLWFEVGQLTRKLLSDSHKTRLIAHLLSLPDYKCFYLDEPRKLTILPPLSEPLTLYGKCERHYSSISAPFNPKLTVPSPEICPYVLEIGFCPERYTRVELEDMEASDVMQYDPDRLVFVASFPDRVAALFPPDVCIEEMQNETFSSWLIMEYLGKCRARGAFNSELRDDWAFGVDIYPIVNQLYKSGFIQKQVFDHNRLILLSRFVDKKLDSEKEEKLPECVQIFDRALADYRTVHPGATSIPKKFLNSYFPEGTLVKKFTEYMKLQGYCRTVYVKKANKNKLGEDAFKAELERTHPLPKLTWKNGLDDSFSAISPEEIEPDHTMARLYRNCVTQTDNTLRLFSFYTGCMHYTARGVDKKMSINYKKSLSVKTVETHKTFVKVTSVVPEQSMQDVSFLSDAQPAVCSSSPVVVSKEEVSQLSSSSVDDCAATPPTPASVNKRSISTAWKDYLTHDLSDFGVVLDSDDFTFKHKFFRTDLQKLRRALILKYLAKVAVIESSPLTNKVGEMESKMGMCNPPWDRKSRKRFLAILTSEGLIGQINAKFERNGSEREIHLVVLPHIDETHPLVYKLANDRATVRFPEKLNRPAGDMDSFSISNADFPPLDQQSSGTAATAAQIHMVHSTQVTEETISNVVNKALNGPHNGSGAGESDGVVALNDVTVDMATEKDVAKMTSQECVASLGASMEEISQDKLPATSLDLEDHPIQLADNEWKPLDVGESNEVVFGQLVPYMHCVKLLHRVVLYMVYGIHPDLPQKYIDHLDMFMLSPCVHGRGWIQYSDFIDMIPMKILGMIMEKNAYKSRYEALGKTLYTSFEPLGVAHPVVRSAIITNDTVVSRIWSFAKILGSLGLMSFLRPEKLGERRRPPFVYVSETAAFYNTCIPLSDTVATPCSPDNFSVAQFTFSDMITVNQYWTALRETCIDSVKTELFQGIPVTSGIFSRKYRLFTNSSTVLDKLFIPKAVAVQQFTLPKFESFGVAGTEKKFDLQDPVHWYPMKKANTETRKLIKSQNMKNRVCKKSSLKLSKKLAEKAVAAAAAVKVNSRRRAAPSLIKRVPTGGRMAWKRGCEMTEKQNKINQEISNRKVTMRVVWSPEEDAVMIHAYVTTYTMRAFVKVNWGFGFFIRDILHELLPQLASTKNEFSINRRFRYLMNNDCKSMLQFFGLRFVASNSTQVLNFFKEAAIDSSMKEEQLWILFKKLYSCILKCNKNWPFVSPQWNMKYVKRNFNILRLFPTDATPLEWQFENEPGLEKWKASLCETILCMIMPYYFEKQYNPYSTPTVVLSKLLGVEHIASIMSTIFGRISSKILSENTKQIKTYPEYGRFLALMKLDRVPSGCMKMFHYWLSKHPLSKSFVSIYEESTVDTSALPELIGKQKAVQWDSWKDDAQTFLLFSAITDDSPYFKVNVEVSEPLFEFPAIKATAAMIEQESRKNRKRAQTEDESGSDHEDLIDQHPKLLNSIIQSNTTILDPPETFHDPQNISSQEDLEGLNLIKKDALLRSRQELNFRLAEYYRSFCAVTTQDKDQKICYHLPKMSLSLHSKLKQKVAEMGKTSQDNNSFLYDVLFQDALSDSTISSVFDLVKIQTPTDLELLPGVPFYMTVHSSTLDIRFDELSNAHRAVYASIHQRSHEGKLYNILRQELIHVSEDILLTILRDLILNGSVIVSGIKSIKFCAREFCPFFTSLRTSEVVVAHRIPLSSSFTTIKFLPSSFVNWDGSFCANFFSTVLNWVIETLSYLPTVNFTELHDRISIYLCPIQFLKVVKLAESLKMLEIREVAEECLTSHSFFENEEVKVNADLKHLFLYPTPDGLVRVKVFCQKFQLQRNLTYIGPQRLSLYASLIDLFKTRKLFDPYFLYYD